MDHAENPWPWLDVTDCASVRVLGCEAEYPPIVSPTSGAAIMAGSPNEFECWRPIEVSVTGEAVAEDSHRGEGVRSAERGFTAAFELVATPAAFGLIGYFIDRWLGTGPIFTLALAGFVTCYVVWKLWYTYSTEMDRLDAERRAGATDLNSPDSGTTEDR